MDFVKYGNYTSIGLMGKMLNNGIRFLASSAPKKVGISKKIRIHFKMDGSKFVYSYNNGILTKISKHVRAYEFQLRPSIELFLFQLYGHHITECPLDKFVYDKYMMIHINGPGENSRYTITLLNEPLKEQLWKKFNSIIYCNPVNYSIV